MARFRIDASKNQPVPDAPTTMNRALVIDGTDHIAGKLAAFIAKRALEGFSVTLLCAESLVFSGPLHRHEAAYKSYLNKRNIVNPARGTFHYKEPSKYFIKILRNMTGRRNVRGSQALARVRVFEGIPREFESVERVLVPRAHRKVVSDPERKFTYLGKLLSKFGWNCSALNEELKNEAIKREKKLRKEEENRKKEREEIINAAEFKKEVKKRLAEFA